MSDITKLDIDIDRKYIINAENPCSGSKHTEKDSVLFLAKDKAFLEGALPGYREKCIELGSNQEHIDSIDLLIGRVAEFQKILFQRFLIRIILEKLVVVLMVKILIVMLRSDTNDFLILSNPLRKL